jgi:hypothetical protein
MKRIIVVVFLAMAIFLVRVGISKAEENTLEFRINYTENDESNFYDPVNMHFLYELTALGTNWLTKYPRNIELDNNTSKYLVQLGGRSVAIAILSQTAKIGMILIHEGGHRETALKNGISNVEIEWNIKKYWQGCTNYWLTNSELDKLSFQQRAKIEAAGVGKNNWAANYTIIKNLGRKIRISELMWFVRHQYAMTNYIRKTDKPPSDLGTYGELFFDTHDIRKWLRYAGNEDYKIMSQLYNDLEFGQYWQGASLILPFGVGVYYWLTGEIITMPCFWVNLQTELTNVGVMYNSDFYYRGRNDIFYQLRLGYGKNYALGVENAEQMYNFGFKISQVPLPIWGLKSGFNFAKYKTADVSRSYGLTLGKDFGPLNIGLEWNKYNGYHPDNPVAEGEYSRVYAIFSCRF